MNVLIQKWTMFLVAVLMIPLWIYVIAPWMTQLPQDFSYQADVVSLDNFYDEEKQVFTGEKRSVTKFSYKVTGEEDGVLTIKNIFDVRQLTGEKIFSVERSYGIDRMTRKHVLTTGDQERDGYLFAPSHLKKGEPFTYWHVNYDGPASMTFAGEEKIEGLTVYRYETRYEGVTIDQTDNLRWLPNVGETRGVKLEPYLQIWVEPVSGHLVKYSDDTIAYFYDVQTGETLFPWNHFSNTFTSESVVHEANSASQQKFTIEIFSIGIPVLWCFFVLILLIVTMCKKRVMVCSSIGASILVLIIGSGVLIYVRRMSVDILNTPNTVVRVGILPSPGAAPLLVALGKEYFSQQGLDVDVRYFDSGKVALNTMFAENNLDIVVVAQTPIVAASFDRQDFAIVSGLSSSLNDVKILVRNDRNIQSVEGLRDKRIGVTKGTTGHYFLGLVLAQNNLDFGDIRMMDFPASELADALYSGQVDAISAWEPYIYNAQKKLEENASLLNTENTFRTDYYLVSPKDWIEKNPEVLQRFLKAVDEANIFIAQYPKESQDIIVASINLEPQLIRSIWNDYVYALFLDQAIVLSLEQQSRWIVASKIIQKNIPANYLNFISSEALQVLKKTAVTIIQ